MVVKSASELRHVCPSFCLSKCIGASPTGRIAVEIWWDFCENLSRNSTFS